MAARTPQARKIRVSSIGYGHSPDKRGRRADRWGSEPITVRRGFWHAYVVIDGNDRLYYAKESGQTWIWAYVF